MFISLAMFFHKISLFCFKLEGAYLYCKAKYKQWQSQPLEWWNENAEPLAPHLR